MSIPLNLDLAESIKYRWNTEAGLDASVGPLYYPMAPEGGPAIYAVISEASLSLEDETSDGRIYETSFSIDIYVIQQSDDEDLGDTLRDTGLAVDAVFDAMDLGANPAPVHGLKRVSGDLLETEDERVAGGRLNYEGTT